MIKINFSLVIVLIFLTGALIVAAKQRAIFLSKPQVITGTFDSQKPALAEVSIIIHAKGKSTYLDIKDANVKQVLVESEKLFETATSGYQLIITKDRIENIKKKQWALEIIYPDIRTKIGNLNTAYQSTLYFTRLLIPLSEQFANGTIFYAGAYAESIGDNKPEYASLSEYGPTNNFFNGQGIAKLKESLQQANVTIR